MIAVLFPHTYHDGPSCAIELQYDPSNLTVRWSILPPNEACLATSSHALPGLSALKLEVSQPDPSPH